VDEDENEEVEEDDEEEEEEAEEDGTGGWADWRNLAQLRAGRLDTTQRPSERPGLPDSQYEVSRRISCTSASMHPVSADEPRSSPPPPRGRLRHLSRGI